MRLASRNIELHMAAVKQQETGDIELGKRLRRLRLERGLTQQDLAQPRYTHAYVSTIEAGRRMPSDEALEFFAQKMGADLDELSTGRPKGLAAELRHRLQDARLQISRGRIREAKAEAQRVIKEAKEFDLPRVQAGGYEIDALATEQSGNLPGAINRWQKAADILGRDAPTASAYAIAGQVRCLASDGDPHHAVYIGETYLDRLQRERMASPAALLRVRSALIHAYFDAGFRAKAEATAEECQQLIPKVNDPANLATAYVNVGAVQLEKGHYADANVSFSKGEELFEILELKNEAGIALLSRGVSLSRDKKLKEARRVLERASVLMTETGYAAQYANAEMELARIDRLEGNEEEASARLEKALEVITPGTQPKLEPWASRELGLTLKNSNKPEAEKHLRKALELYELQNNPLEVARTYILMAEQRGVRETKAQLEDYRRAAEAIHQMPEM